MNYKDIELTLPSEEEIWGDKQLDVLAKYGTAASITDLGILTGGHCKPWAPNVSDDNTPKGRTGSYFTCSSNVRQGVTTVDNKGQKSSVFHDERYCTIRPVLKSVSLFTKIYQNIVRRYNRIKEVEYGEYPQYVPNRDIQSLLEEEYQKGLLRTTGKDYTFDRTDYDDIYHAFHPEKYDEYEYQGRKYIRYYARMEEFHKQNAISSGGYVHEGYYWIEVSPVIWLVDEKSKTLISKRGLLSGIRLCKHENLYYGDFSKTEMKQYLDKYMLHDLIQSEIFTHIEDMPPEEREQTKKRINPYGLKFGTISEEEIIRGSIESGVAVFLHGPSSEGKSARVKQIDPTCEIIYLRNATPESLNGKSVYNQQKGEMMDIKPSWLKKLEEKCKIEPDKLHVVFFDEITNALPSIQGIAFNIVLNREVNGIWQLPENARIVAAGNEMKDSLAANKLAEPLFNRFAHVYIKTTTESWLKWASEHNIHPAIYSFIAYTKGEVLRSKYDGEKPNADPRKWEMASKMLYATGSPEMLRALVGEEITSEFVEFCKQQVISLDDVINENYTTRDIQTLNTAERYATTMGLSQVDDENLEKVRDFVKGLGAEFGAIFDALWTHGDETRLERLAEAKLAEIPGGGIRK